MQLSIKLIKKKWVFLFLLYFISILEVQADPLEEEKEIDEMVFNIIESFNANDAEKFNQYVNPKTGLFVFYTLETVPVLRHLEGLCFSNNGYDCPEEKRYPLWWSIDEIYQFTMPFKREKFLDNFGLDCEKIGPEGVYIEPEMPMVNDLKELHEMMEGTYEYLRQDGIVDETVTPYTESKEINNLNVVKVIVIDNREKTYSHVFIFYLSKIENKWWIVAIKDRSITLELDCRV